MNYYLVDGIIARFDFKSKSLEYCKYCSLKFRFLRQKRFALNQKNYKDVIFHIMKFDLKGYSRSCNANFKL